YLKNDSEIHAALRSPTGWVHQVCESAGVATPRPLRATGNSGNNMQKQIDRRKAQVLLMIERFDKLPKARQLQARKGVEAKLRTLRKRAKAFDFHIPSLDELLETPGAWPDGSGAWPDESAVRPDVGDTAASGAAGKQKFGTASVDSLIEEAYLRTLSRLPDERERGVATEFLGASPSLAEGTESLLWALINTKEFILAH
ncbi:MAG: hypothetical protein AAF958_03585, partial [Planctomycetota bacterium]